MSVVFDAQLANSAAQTHVLIIGVGDYPHLLGGSKSHEAPADKSFGLQQLTSPAISASAFANWIPFLANRKAPIGTVELLLSPNLYVRPNGTCSEVELPTMMNVQNAFKRWSERASRNVKNVAIFYYCGHGLEKDVTFLLPCDFGNPEVKNVSANMIDFDQTFVCNLLESSAETQLYFLDCCRETPTELLALRPPPPALISTSKVHFPPRDAPVIKATRGGHKAHGKKGEVTFFTQALLACLQKMGARGKNGEKWEVTTSSLSQAMKYCLQRMTPFGFTSLACDVGGRSNFDTVLHAFSSPAYVMSSIDCDPDAALGKARFFIRQGEVEVHCRNTPVPAAFEVEIQAGQYDIAVDFAEAQYVNKVCTQLMQPPYTPCTLGVG